MRKRSFLIGLAFIIAGASTSIAYDQYDVHPKINENALVQSKTDDYLKTQLGFANGIEDVVKGQRIRIWVMDGGTFEDEPVCRTKFHFHDPTKPFDQAGLSNIAIDTSWVAYKYRSFLVKKGVA